MGRSISITVAVCTHNNAAVLERMLKHLSRACALDAGTHDVLVVANACADSTVTVAKRISPLFGGRLRVVSEEAVGLSNARNRALVESTSDSVAYLDDDVIVDERWLVEVRLAFEEYSANVVGGRSYLLWPSPSGQPAWLGDRLLYLLSRLDHGDQPIAGRDVELYGLNFAVDRRAALSVGGFSAHMGRRGGLLLSGEEKALQARVAELGKPVVYWPRAIVGHIVPVERTKPGWFFRRSIWGGVSDERYAPGTRGIRGLTRAAFRFVRAATRAFALLVAGDTQEAMYKACGAMFRVGTMLEVSGIARLFG